MLNHVLFKMLLRPTWPLVRTILPVCVTKILHFCSVCVTKMLHFCSVCVRVVLFSKALSDILIMWKVVNVFSGSFCFEETLV